MDLVIQWAGRLLPREGKMSPKDTQPDTTELGESHPARPGPDPPSRHTLHPAPFSRTPAACTWGPPEPGVALPTLHVPGLGLWGLFGGRAPASPSRGGPPRHPVSDGASPGRHFAGCQTARLERVTDWLAAMQLAKQSRTDRLWLLSALCRAGHLLTLPQLEPGRLEGWGHKESAAAPRTRHTGPARSQAERPDKPASWVTMGGSPDTARVPHGVPGGAGGARGLVGHFSCQDGFLCHVSPHRVCRWGQRVQRTPEFGVCVLLGWGPCLGIPGIRSGRL